MIALQLEGRLGNQLFQYAFIYSASKRLNTHFYIDKSIEKFTLPQYFEIEKDFTTPLDKSIFSITGFKNLFNIHIKKAFYKQLGHLIFKGRKISFDNRTPVQKVLSAIKNNYMYKGYFQSESYFKNFENEIRALYKIREKYILDFEQLKQKLPPSKKKAVIHIRRGDYVDLNMSLPISYYKKAMAMIESSDVDYIFISDDPTFIEKEFSYIPNKYVSANSEIIDLQFLMDAGICVLSNSSFSWWGAWLNNKVHKQVLAPKYWLGYQDEVEYPLGICDGMNFNWVEVPKSA